MNSYQLKEYLMERGGFSAENLLLELVHAMGEQDAKENFEFIAQMWDIELPEKETQ